MIKIGDFSHLAHVTIKALRHYDELGLLKPVWIDRYSGYRYYALEQLPRLNRILALKDLGFSLGQVKELLDEELPYARLRSLFDQKQAELQIRLRDEEVRLRRVEQRLVEIEQEGRLPVYEVTLKSLPELAVISQRMAVRTLDELPQQVELARSRVADGLTQARLRCSGTWLVLYHNQSYVGHDLDVEIALALEAGSLPRNQRLLRRLGIRYLAPIAHMASLVHTGPLASPPVFSALYTWAERGGYQPDSPVRELLLDEPDQPAHPALVRPWIQERSVSVEGQPASGQLNEVQLPVIDRQVYAQNYLSNPNRKENEMEPTYVSLPAFTVVGMRYFGKNEHLEISELWGRANQKLHLVKNVCKDAAFGVCTTVPGAAPGEFEYVAGLQVSKVEDLPDGFVVREVPAHKYAVFTHVGALEKLRDTYNYIYQVWANQPGNQLAGDVDFEYYDADFKDFAPDSRFYIYVPVKE